MDIGFPVMEVTCLVDRNIERGVFGEICHGAPFSRERATPLPPISLYHDGLIHAFHHTLWSQSTYTGIPTRVYEYLPRNQLFHCTRKVRIEHDLGALLPSTPDHKICSAPVVLIFVHLDNIYRVDAVHDPEVQPRKMPLYQEFCVNNIQ